LIQVAFFSLTSGAVSGNDAAYLRWHLLDHLPEQYSIPGLRLGTRWRADDRCVALRAAVDDDLAPVRHAVSYLMADPVDETLAEFARLGRRLAEAGRYPEAATPHLLGALRREEAWSSPAALVSSDVVPFRAHRGVYLIVERPSSDDAIERWLEWHRTEHVPAVLDVAGVAGVWAFRSHPSLGVGPEQGERYGTAAPWDPGRSLITLVYLDADVPATATALDPLVRERWASGDVVARLAGPFLSTVAYEAWPPAS
jgi:hypothetical protein